MPKMNYQYGTSPRKLEPNYNTNKKSKKDYEEQIRINREQRKEALKLEKKKQTKNVAFILGIFLMLFTVSFRSSLINERFNELQNSKEKLAAIQKTNGQLEVSIEGSLNLGNIEQSAKEKLGMQKLDNSQKVYVTLDKKDYVESVSKDIKITDDESVAWYQKILNKLLGK